MEEMCREQNLLSNDGGVIRLPFLVKGRLVAPPEISPEQIEVAFGQADRDATYVKLPGAQVVREPVIDRVTMKYTGEYLYQVMPPLSGPELIETDYDGLVSGLYALSVEDILAYLESILATLLTNSKLAARVRELTRLTSEFSDAFLDGWFDSFHASFSREAARQMIDNELAFWGRPGTDFLNGWVEVPARIPGGKPLVRAMPTRQLHITAGNAPEVPVISALRAVLTKSAAVIKLPYGATLTGAMLALAAAAAEPEHPITRSLSLVYWPGGDETVENALFTPNAFDRIVVWGNPETVTSVQSRALFTRVICLNPRYGVTLVGSEAFSGKLEEATSRAAADVMIYNQKACTSSLVHYVEGTGAQADAYAAALAKALNTWDRQMPNFVPPSTAGQLKRMRRGKYAGARWYLNTRDEGFTSGVAVMPGEFDVLDHPMCRLAVVRPVAGLADALQYLNQNVSTAGVYPEERRHELKDRILARGVSNVLPLGQCQRVYFGMPHDGMRVLSQLVDWKNG